MTRNRVRQSLRFGVAAVHFLEASVALLNSGPAAASASQQKTVVAPIILSTYTRGSSERVSEERSSVNPRLSHVGYRAHEE